MYSFTVLESRSLESVSMGRNQGFGKVALSSEAPFSITFLLLPDSGGCLWHITSTFKARIFKSLFSVSSYGFPLGVAQISVYLHIRIYMIAFRTHSDNPG